MFVFISNLILKGMMQNKQQSFGDPINQNNFIINNSIWSLSTERKDGLLMMNSGIKKKKHHSELIVLDMVILGNLKNGFNKK